MKKLALLLAVLVLILAIPGAAFAQKSNWDGLVHKGDLAAFLGVGFGWGFTIAPGVEWAFADVKIGDTVPLAFGVVGRGMVNFYPNYFTSYGIGALASAHMGLKGLDIPKFLQNLDFYIALGLGVSFFNYVSSTYDFGDVQFGFATTDGVAYYFNDKWAVYLEGTYWGYSGGGAIGVRYTF
jgi:hypothetical protein